MIRFYNQWNNWQYGYRTIDFIKASIELDYLTCRKSDGHIVTACFGLCGFGIKIDYKKENHETLS